MKVGAVILAAGGSLRLGEPKQLLQFRGQALVRRAVAAALDADCQPVAVVIGAEREKVRLALAGLPVLFVPNENWRRGIGSSIRAGVEALRDCEAIAILACDQPHAGEEVIRNLIRGQAETQKSIVACAYSGTLGAPALFGRDYFGRLLSLTDGEGAKSIIESEPNDVARVDFAEGAFDIDIAADYDRLLEAG